VKVEHATPAQMGIALIAKEGFNAVDA